MKHFSLLFIISIIILVGAKTTIAQDTNKDGYHDEDVEVLKNILKNNNAEGKLDWEGSDYSSYSGIKWNDNTPKRITSIFISSKSLDGYLKLSSCTELTYLRCRNNNISNLDISQCKQLTYLNCEKNNISELDISNCYLLTRLDCDENQISELDISNCPLLITLSIDSNKLSFSELSKINVNGFNYHSNKKIFEEKEYFTITSEIDFSSEEIINGKNSDFKWFKDGKILKGINSSRYTASDFGNYYCIITNSEFPDLTLVTNKITIQKNEYVPSFSDQEFVLIKGNKNGTIIGSIIINDKDSPKNLIHYEIDSNNFKIDKTTGEITIIDASSIDYENAKTIKITITINDNKHEAISKEFIIKIVDKDTNKDGYHDEDVEVLKNILKNNNSKGKLDWKGTDYSSYLGITWNNNNPKRITEIKLLEKSLNGNLNIGFCTELISLDLRYSKISILDIYNCSLLTNLNCQNNKISDLDISNCSLLTNLICNGNKISDLDISNCKLLTKLDCSQNKISDLDISSCKLLRNLICNDNKISDLDISNCKRLTKLDCSMNKISDLDISNCSLLTSLSCNNNDISSLNNYNCPLLKNVSIESNKLSFSELSKINIDGFNYHSNKKIFEEKEYFTIPKTIDFSSEAIINGKNSDFKWFKDGKLLKGINSSRYTANDFGNYYCSITNSEFLNLTLVTNTIRIQKNEYAPSFSDQEFVLIKGNKNASRIGSIIINDKDSPKNLTYYKIKENKNFKIDKTTGEITVIDTSSIDYENAKTLKITITINDNKYEATSKEFTIKIVDKDTNKDGYHDEDVEVLKNILKNNNAEGKLDWEGFDYSSYSGITWNDNIPKRITRIDIFYKSLDGDLKIGSCTELIILNCGYNNISTLDLSNCSLLEYLYCENNNISNLDVSNCTLLKNLMNDDNKISTLNLSQCKQLTNLTCERNKISELDISNCQQLTYLDCFSNKLINLDISNCQQLTYLGCSSNKLINLDISNCTLLTKLDCYSNKLINLDISNCTLLTELNCDSNKLITLDISNCTLLTRLNCKNNDISSIDISNCTLLTKLDCDSNKLINLDISNCTLLTSLSCNNNDISSLNSYNYPLLKNVSIDLNKLSFSELSKINVDGFNYHSSKKIFEEKEYFTIPKTIDFSSEEIINGKNSDFKWFKDGKILKGINSSRYTASDFGNYYCSITSSEFPDITLITNTIRIQKNEYAPSFSDQEFVLIKGNKNASRIGSIIINDKDSPKNIIHYEIKENKNFIIDKTTGEITIIDASSIDYENANTIKITITINDNKHEAISKEFTIKIVDKDTNKDGYHDEDVEILKNILKNNNSKGTLDWEGTDYSSYSGITWNNNNPKRITEINISDKSLDGDLKIGSGTELTYLRCNTNNIDKLDISNCSLLTKLYCQENNISTIDVSNFLLLTRLDCSQNKISELDISNCSLLTRLYCTNNQISKLDVSNCSLLTILKYDNNIISEIDISNCSLLTILNCSDNKISDLDISNCSLLTSLTCSDNKISDLDISNCPILTELDCDSNKLSFSELSKINVDGFNYHSSKKIFEEKEYFTIPKTIDFSSEAIINGKNSDFKWFKDEKFLKGINSSKYTASDFGNYYCSITNSEFPDLTLVTNKIIIQKNEYAPSISDQEFVLIKGNKNASRIGSIIINDKDSPKNLIHYEISNNNFMIDEKTGEIIIRDTSGIDYYNTNTIKITITINDNKHEAISKEFTIKIVDKDTNKDGYHDQDVEVLKNILENNNAEVKLDWKGTNYSSYSGIKWNDNTPKRITEINISDKSLDGDLKIGSCTELINLDCRDNNISSLDLSQCKQLTYLKCERNKISELDISNCEQLKWLNCSSNKLINLDISNCTLLTDLVCYSNKLINLDIFNCTLLTKLDCESNKISNLDISNCTLLTKLSCERNKISNLDISNCTLLTYLVCYSNKLINLDISNCTLLTKLNCESNKISNLDISNCTLLTSLTCSDNKISDLDISNCPLLTSLICNNNDISSLDISNCTLLQSVSIDSNKLSFSELSKINVDGFNYHSNKKIFEEKEYFTIPQTIDFSSEEIINGKKSDFEWFKDGNLLKGINSSRYTASDLGNYYCSITNSEFPNLTLVTNTIRIQKNEYAPSFSDQEFTLIKGNKDGTIIGSIIINDKDSPKNLINYEINDNNNIFIINAETGDIIIKDASSIDYENVNTIKITITIDDNKFEAISKEFTIKIVDKDSNKDGYHDHDVEVLKNILKNNNTEAKLDWKGTDYSSYSGITWNDNTPKRITEINITYRSLNGDLKIGSCTELINLDLRNNNISMLDASNCAQLTSINCLDNKISELDVSNCALLTSLNCVFNKISDLDFSNCALLTSLNCASNKISDLDISNCSLLTSLTYYNNNISTLDISNCSLLTSLTCYNNNISTLDISNCTRLTSLNCYNNKIRDLDISNCSLLTSLTCYNNNISTLDISYCSLLTSLTCYNNNISTLDISNCTRLTSLDCDNNKISDLDISNCSLLTSLYCSDNKISDLDISYCSLLTSLTCYNNNISTLDISNCSLLTEINCDSNKLSFSELSKISIDGFNYDSSKKIFEKEECFTIPKTIDFSSEEIINGKKSDFKWFKDGKLLKAINSSTYTTSDFGDYYCKITNSEFPGLTLVTNTITIQINDYAPSFSDQELISSKYNKNGIIIGSIIINDKDKPKNFIHYEINDNDFFIINKNTGDIITRYASKIDYENTNKVNITITIRDNKFGAISKEFTIKIVDKDSNKDGYHDEDVEVLKNILTKNNAAGELDWEGTNYSFYSGITWNNNTPKRITGINIDSKSLIGNLDVSNCSLLTFLNLRNNNISCLNISKCSLLTYLNLYDNNISTLDISNYSLLTEIVCESNKLSFSELSKIKTDQSNYQSSKKVFEEKEYFTIPQTIDFSSEAIINWKISDFKWFKDGKLLEGKNSSRYTASDFGNYYCSITNSEFPNLTLVTNTIKIQKNEYAPSFSDQEFVLIKGNKSGTIIGSVIINDKDSPKNPIHYEIKENKNFIIDEKTGEITIIDASSIDYENASTIKITIKDNKYEAISKEFTIKIVDKDSNKDGYHDQDVEVLKNILKNNNTEGKLDWEGTDYSSYSGITWNDNTPKRITEISLKYKSLNGYLKLSSCTKLTYLRCNSNNIDKLDISNCSLLTKLYCQENNISTIDVSNFSLLTRLDCSRNKISELDISNCSLLTRLYCKDNQVSELDISNCSLLTILYCTNNQISKLDVSNCSLLTTLNYDNNIISEIDISNCSLLTTLSCSDNKIIDLDISNCSLLTHLDCSDNKIGELNISNCVLLEELECYDNKISELDLSKCSLLTNLDCKSNKLKTIEIQNCTKLLNLWCQNNNLVFSQLVSDISNISYYPQNKVFEEKTYYTFPQILDYSSEEIINGIASEYKWYKNGKLIEEANSSIYSAITPGNYYCKITNTVFSDLILTTNTVRLQINDNAPTFSDQEFELAEGYKIGTIIGQVEINDIDKPRNPVNYKIEDNTHISINPKTGEITLTDLFYPTNKIYIDITINDNKHDDVSKRFTINIVDRDINKDGYHDNDVEVLKNILENNNSRGKIDWQGTDYSTYKGIVWDDNTPRQIIDIKLNFKDLDGDLNISDCNKLVNIDFISNDLSSINISGCNQLYKISCGYNDIKNLHISNCYKLTYTGCENNELYNIDISDCPSLRGLSIRDNYFSFSELYKLKMYGLLNYTAQHKLYKKRDHYINTIIDFSSEENIGSTKTVFRWYKDNELIDNEHNSSLTPTEFGVYYCMMTNTEFPNLELTTNDITIIETNKYQTYIPRNQKFYLDENTTEVISLGFVKIYDKDYIKDKVTFNTESKIFDIDKDTGELFYNSEIKINYEETESISIEVTVKGEKHPLDKEKVIIYVNDINEAPSDILLSNNMILRDSEKGCLIGTLSSQDEDKNDIISYDILENKHFELDNNNLILKLELNFDDTQIYKILVSAVDKGGLACTKVLEIIEDTTTGIIELKNIETKLYPNPVEDNLNIQISGLENKDVHISIYSLSGEALLKQKYQVENGQLIEEINMHNFSSGTYLMMLVQNKIIKSYKIIKL